MAERQREYKAFPANASPHWRRKLRADEMPSRESVRRPKNATPRRGDWR